MAFEETGQLTLKNEHVDAVVKNFSLQEFKMYPLCNVVKTNSDKNTYYDEQDSDNQKTVTTGITATTLSKTPRGAEFNILNHSWEKQSEYPSKHTGKSVILWEDFATDSFNVVGRSSLRVVRAIGLSQDTVIITELNTTTNTSAASATWDNADVSIRNPKLDILTAIEGMELENWDAIKNNAHIVMHPTNKKECLANGGMGDDYENIITEKGRTEKLVGLTLISTKAQTENTVTLVIPKVAMNWYEVSPLKSQLVERFGIDYTISAFLYGVPALVNNNAAYKLTGC